MNKELKNITIPKEFFTFNIISINNVEAILESAIGQNKKKCLVVFPISDDVNDYKELLRNILKAVSFTLPTDVLILKLTDNDTFSLSSLFSHVEIDNILIFGFSPSFFGLNWQLPKYHPFAHKEKKYLFSDELKKLHADKNLKMQLWKCLQAMFI